MLAHSLTTGMFHIWKLGKEGCRLLAKDFTHFVKTQNLKGSQLKKNAIYYGKEAIGRWTSYTSLKPASACVVAQKLFQLHKYKRISTPNPKRVDRNGIAKMAILLSIKDGNLFIRHRDTWTKQMQKGDAGMLVRGKKEYEWEELPSGHNNRRKEKPKPGSLGERILFKGDEQALYAKYASHIPADETIHEQGLLLQRLCMKNMVSVGVNFHISAAKIFMRKFRQTDRVQQTDRMPKKRKTTKKSAVIAAKVSGVKKPKTTDPIYVTKKKRSKLGRSFDQTVANAVMNGEHEEDAAARIIHELIDGRKEIVRAVAATPIGSSTVVEDIVESQVEMGREEFERGLEYVVGRANFSNKTYSDSVQPTVNRMQQAVIGDAGKDLACSVHKLTHHKKCRRKNNRARFFKPCDTGPEAHSCLVVKEKPYLEDFFKSCPTVTQVFKKTKTKVRWHQVYSLNHNTLHTAH